jgi:hypothetical protein
MITTERGTNSMDRLKVFFALLSILIIVVPITVEVVLYRDNLIALVVPSELANLINHNSNSGNSNNLVKNDTAISSLVNSGFDLPQPVGEPQYNPETKTVSFTFNFTNPLQTPLVLNKLEASIVSHDTGVFLGNVTLEKPLEMKPGQTMDITALDALSDETINYFKTNSFDQKSINADFVNLTVDLGGVIVQIDRQNIGDIPIPAQFLK